METPEDYFLRAKALCERLAMGGIAMGESAAVQGMLRGIKLTCFHVTKCLMNNPAQVKRLKFWPTVEAFVQNDVVNMQLDSDHDFFPAYKRITPSPALYGGELPGSRPGGGRRGGRGSGGGRGGGRGLRRCTHCGVEGHLMEQCWKLHPHLRSKGGVSAADAAKKVANMSQKERAALLVLLLQ